MYHDEHSKENHPNSTWRFLIPHYGSDISNQYKIWRLIDVTFPNKDYSNGMVTIHDSSGFNLRPNKILCQTTMWYAKLFGMIWNNFTDSDKTTDMKYDRYSKKLVKNTDGLNSFDHMGYDQCKKVR